jgi:hypothetical protein
MLPDNLRNAVFFISNYIETMVLRLHFYNDLFKTESLYEFWIRSAAGNIPHDLLIFIDDEKITKL